MLRSIRKIGQTGHCSQICVKSLQFLSCYIHLQALDQDRKSLNDKLWVRSAEYLLFLDVLLSKFVDVEQEAGDCSEIVWIVFLRVWVNQWLEELKIIEYLRKCADQRACLDGLLSKSKDYRHVLLSLICSTWAQARGSPVLGLCTVLHACLVHHILKFIIRCLRQKDVVVKKLRSYLPQQGDLQSLQRCLGKICLTLRIGLLDIK